MLVNMKNLIGRLNETCAGALREGARQCQSRTHYDVDMRHLMLALIDAKDSDVQPILRQWDVSPANVRNELEKSLRSLRTGNASTPRFSPHLVRWLQASWMWASVEFGAHQVRSGHMLLALLADEEFVLHAQEMAPSLKAIKVDELKDLFERLVQKSAEDPGTGGAGAAAAGAEGARTVGANQGTPALDQYSRDLTAEAKSGKQDPIVGRDGEIRQMIDILLRRRKNNPIVVGEAGVGKTAVVEGLAQRIAKGEVPGPLKNVALKALDITLLQAGAGVKGEFENRLKEVIKEVKASPTPIVLFIDEVHTLMGAGGQAGTGDAANLLKPALARGELRTIGATTYAEYKKYIEKDAALERRFQPVHVGEPDVELATRMMREVADNFEKHHSVRVLDEAVKAAVELSHRYITGRQLPDKCTDLLDTACARVALAKATVPEPLEARQWELRTAERELAVLEREQAAGDGEHGKRITELRAKQARLQGEIADVSKRHDECKAVVDRLLAARVLLEAVLAKREAPKDMPADLARLSEAELRSEATALKAKLHAIQGEEPLMWACVDAEVVADVISSWTGIPAGRMMTDEIVAVQGLLDTLEKRVVGQGAALAEIVKRIQVSKAGLEDPNKPVGVFLLAGPSGVGKTETALALADVLYGGERNLITINMSEYQESHSVSGLKGSPKGYVGYGEGGALTEPVRQRPYSVVLLDEVEKAHHDVMEIFYQVFDKGMLEDTSGRIVNFRNTIIIMCSNLGGDELVKSAMKRDFAPMTAEDMYEIVQPKLRGHFPAAFLGRCVPLPFAPLHDDVMAQITRLKLGKVVKRIASEHGTELTFDDSVIASVVSRCHEVETGARNVDNIITNSLLPDMGRRVLGWMADGKVPASLRVSVGADGAFVYEPSAPATGA